MRIIIIHRPQKMISKWKIFLMILSLIDSTSSSLSLSVDNPFLLSPLSLKITALNLDLSNSFLVGFDDGQVRRYSQDFSSYTPLTVPEPVDKFVSRQIDIYDIDLSNGTVWNMFGKMTITLSTLFNGRTAFTVYSSPEFTQINRLVFLEPILKYTGVPIHSPPNMTPVHLLAFNQTIKVIYKGEIITAFDLVDTFGPDSYCTAVTVAEEEYGFLGDYMEIIFPFFETVTGVGLVSIRITAGLTYNFSSLTYDLVLSKAWDYVSTFGYSVVSMVMEHQLILMQVEGGSLLLHFNGITSALFSDSIISSSPILSLLYNDTSYYVLFSKGLVLLSFDEASSQYLGSSLVSALPDDNYEYVSGLLYVPMTPYIYKANCHGRFSDDGLGNCIEYSCTVPNCLQCQLTANTCGICEAGFIRNENLTCSFSQPSLQSAFHLLEVGSSLKRVFWASLNASKALISVPSMRSTPLFYYFGNFDDLYLYMFHDRLYGSTMGGLFKEINEIEAKKWSVLNYAAQLGWLRAGNESFYAFQDSFLTYEYSTPGRQSAGSEGLVANCFNFFIVGLPLTAVAYIIMRICFRILFKFPVSRLLRKFDFLGYFPIIIFEGNLQNFAFYLTAEWRNAFAYSFGDGCLKAGIFLFGFIVVITSIGGFLVTFGFYRKLNTYMTENNYNNLKGNSYLLLQFGFRNFLLGMLHSILRPFPYTTMISILMVTELLFCALFTVSVSLGAYRAMHCIWTYIILTFIRIVLILTLFFDYSQRGDPLIEAIQFTIIVVMILIYFGGTLITTLKAIAQLILHVAKVMKWSSNEPTKIQCQEPIIKPRSSLLLDSRDSKLQSVQNQRSPQVKLRIKTISKFADKEKSIFDSKE